MALRFFDTLELVNMIMYYQHATNIPLYLSTICVRPEYEHWIEWCVNHGFDVRHDLKHKFLQLRENQKIRKSQRFPNIVWQMIQAQKINQQLKFNKDFMTECLLCCGKMWNSIQNNLHLFQFISNNHKYTQYFPTLGFVQYIPKSHNHNTDIKFFKITNNRTKLHVHIDMKNYNNIRIIYHSCNRCGIDSYCSLNVTKIGFVYPNRVSDAWYSDWPDNHNFMIVKRLEGSGMPFKFNIDLIFKVIRKFKNLLLRANIY